MILIIDNYDSFTYNLYQAIATMYSDIKIVRNDKISVNDIKLLQPMGILLSPGPGRPEQAGICVDLIRAIVDRVIPETPLLGVCLGHQALTVALGGRVIQAHAILHGKDDLIYHKNQELYQSMSLPFKAGRYHSLMAERDTLPVQCLIEAENHEQMIMGIRHRDLPLYGVQFHPESILTPEGQTLIKNFIAICKKYRDTKEMTV